MLRTLTFAIYYKKKPNVSYNKPNVNASFEFATEVQTKFTIIFNVKQHIYKNMFPDFQQ